ASELFEQLFGGMRGARGGSSSRRRGGGGRTRQRPAVEADMGVPFLTAVNGGTVTIDIDGREIDVKVPAGSEDGQNLRLQGQAPGGADLIVRLRVEPHPYFQREGNNIVLEVPITVSEAVLGTKVEVPTIKGERLTVTIKPGASSGSRRRLPGFGVSG